jgi:hypothetical protein
MDRLSSTTCSGTLGSGTMPVATNSDPFATFSPRYLFSLTMTGVPSIYGKILGIESGLASPSYMTASISSSLGSGTSTGVLTGRWTLFYRALCRIPEPHAASDLGKIHGLFWIIAGTIKLV